MKPVRKPRLSLQDQRAQRLQHIKKNRPITMGTVVLVSLGSVALFAFLFPRRSAPTATYDPRVDRMIHQYNRNVDRHNDAVRNQHDALHMEGYRPSPVEGVWVKNR